MSEMIDEDFAEGLIDLVIYVVGTFGPPSSSGRNNPIGALIWEWEDEQQAEAFQISVLDGSLGIWIESLDPKYQPVFDFAKERGLDVKRAEPE